MDNLDYRKWENEYCTVNNVGKGVFNGFVIFVDTENEKTGNYSLFSSFGKHPSKYMFGHMPKLIKFIGHGEYAGRVFYVSYASLINYLYPKGRHTEATMATSEKGNLVWLIPVNAIVKMDICRLNDDVRKNVPADTCVDTHITMSKRAWVRGRKSAFVSEKDFLNRIGCQEFNDALHMSKETAAEHAGVSVPTIYNYAKKFGVKFKGDAYPVKESCKLLGKRPCHRHKPNLSKSNSAGNRIKGMTKEKFTAIVSRITDELRRKNKDKSYKPTFKDVANAINKALNLKRMQNGMSEPVNKTPNAISYYVDKFGLREMFNCHTRKCTDKLTKDIASIIELY